jgi:hypothetical protein
MNLPCEIIEKIAIFTGDRVVVWTLRNYMTEIGYKKILLAKTNILIYGQVQSGKTAAIMDIIKKPLYEGIQKIVIIQNSLLVMKQYLQRFNSSNIDVQIIDGKTNKIESEVILLINNKSRYRNYCKCENLPKKYIIIMDEADSYGIHALAEKAIHNFYVTATPYHPFYKIPEFFNRIKHITPPSNYQGLLDIDIEYDNGTIEDIISKFINDTENGMMLINSFRYVKDMISIANKLSNIFPNVCFVTLNSNKRIFIKGKNYLIKNKSIANIIDLLKDVPHIVLIAHRLSLRGLSYMCSNYIRHLTHQYSDLYGKNITSSLQRMRIFGIYNDKTPVKLIVPSNNYKKINKMIKALDINLEMNRWFTIK